MTQHTLFNTLNDRLNKVFADSAVRQDIQKSIHTLVQTALNKLNLVTREEFDTQLEVLRQTRAKVSELEKLLEELKTQSQNSAGS